MYVRGERDESEAAQPRLMADIDEVVVAATRLPPQKRVHFWYMKAGALDWRHPTIPLSLFPPPTTNALNVKRHSVILSPCLPRTALTRPSTSVHFLPSTTHYPILNSCLQTDAELSRLIGTLRLNAKVRTFDCL